MVYRATMPKAPAPQTAGRPHDVFELQECLRKISFHRGGIPPVTATGVYSPETAQAVAVFQRELGLPETGRVDPATWSAVYSEYARVVRQQEPPRPVSPFAGPQVDLGPGDRGDAVYLLQIMLAALARQYCNLSAPGISGVYDPQTSCAVGDFQGRCGMRITGLTDKPTWNMLAAVYGGSHE